MATIFTSPIPFPGDTPAPVRSHPDTRNQGTPATVVHRAVSPSLRTVPAGDYRVVAPLCPREKSDPCEASGLTGRPGIDQGVPVSSKSEQPVPARPTPGIPGTGDQIAALLGFLTLTHTVSFLGSLAIIANAHGWYAAANKAPWTPPDWVFGMTWTMLYTAMAVAAWLVWRRRSGRRRALSAFGVQLALNLAWTPTFFGMYPMLGTTALWLALVIITALALGVCITVLRFGPISRTAGLLMLPYMSWIIFSATLNFFAATTN